jgi:hypothetical protein
MSFSLAHFLYYWLGCFGMFLTQNQLSTVKGARKLAANNLMPFDSWRYLHNYLVILLILKIGEFRHYFSPRSFKIRYPNCQIRGLSIMIGNKL